MLKLVRIPFASSLKDLTSKQFACMLLCMLSGLPAWAAPLLDVPYAIHSVYSAPSTGQMQYRLVRFNTEIEPCLHLSTIDWAKNPSAVTATSLCRFVANKKSYAIAPDSIQDIGYANLRWEDAIAHFVIDYTAADTATPRQLFQCQLVVTQPSPAISCTPLDTDGDAWDATSPKAL